MMRPEMHTNAGFAFGRLDREMSLAPLNPLMTSDDRIGIRGRSSVNRHNDVESKR
jgi:hypothetical protein